MEMCWTGWSVFWRKCRGQIEKLRGVMPRYNLHVLGLDIFFNTDADDERVTEAKDLIENRFGSLNKGSSRISKEKLLIFFALSLRTITWRKGRSLEIEEDQRASRGSGRRMTVEDPGNEGILPWGVRDCVGRFDPMLITKGAGFGVPVRRPGFFTGKPDGAPEAPTW